MTGFTPTLSTEDLRARLASATPPRLLDVRTRRSSPRRTSPARTTSRWTRSASTARS